MTGIYLDFAATTPIDPRVRAAMEPLLSAHFGNPHAEHSDAIAPAAAIDTAEKQVAHLIGAQPGEIVFTSGATEANNAALKGVMRSTQRRGDHLIVSAIEHSCVLESARALERSGCTVTFIPVDRLGYVTTGDVLDAVTPETALISIMLVNNELGTRQPVREIVQQVAGQGIVTHTDAAQAVARIRVDVHDLGVDLLSLSGHKLYGPKGIGALYSSSDCPVRLEPLIHGGGQQGGRRGGTVPAFLCAGLGAAAEQAMDALNLSDTAFAAARYFIESLDRAIEGVDFNGFGPTDYDGIVSVRFHDAKAIDVLQHLYGRVSASLGSACHAGSIEPSHVLQAIGLDTAQMSESIRFSFGRDATEIEVDRAVSMIADAVLRTRALNL
ncbi:cysteine desulfurase family protein [Ahrensia sp. R2A130]|uniref:cysteine desulfurase family protein n=1 Tax=Ahrensia sp. R2A130 TaxID=744979 RepID=UPI0001E0BC6A|nr:cysteine desulfurase family protein [Ahrensia sp. R2A130]EFL89436.1 cysteine desulfurase [Ahrensia sp. R2A130]